MSMQPESNLPVAVLGAGPVGLAAAAHLLERGLEPLVLEAGPHVGAHVREWGHVRLFSPWKMDVDDAARRLLEAEGWREPDPEAWPTGGDLVERYLEPLARTRALAPRLRFGARVVGVARRGWDKLKTEGREHEPFAVHVETASGEVEVIPARAVLDATGTWGRPNPMGSNGLPAPGERRFGERVAYGIPDVLGSERETYAGRTTLVVGAGHSSFHAVLDLLELAETAPETRVAWAVRSTDPSRLWGGETQDRLSARGALGRRVREVTESGALRLVTGFRTAALEADGEGIAVQGEDGRVLPGIDRIVAATGFRPDLSILSELRLDLDPVVESPRALAPLIDPNVHSCGTVPPHGARELAHPEPGFFVVGMKSYGRAPTFLLKTGYEQVRSIAAELAGDVEAARQVCLTLPETGVCSLDGMRDRVAAAACC